jgi:hypothetical protein
MQQGGPRPPCFFGCCNRGHNSTQEPRPIQGGVSGTLKASLAPRDEASALATQPCAKASSENLRHEQSHTAFVPGSV